MSNEKIQISNKLNRSLKFIGRGSAFNTDELNTSAYIKYNRTILLIDCGENIFSNIKKNGLLDDIDNIYILITHLHSDHVGSLSSLIFYMYYEKRIKANILLFPNLELYLKLQGNIKGMHYNEIKSTFIDELNLNFIITNETHEQMKESKILRIDKDILIEETKPILPSYGYKIIFKDKSKLYYTGDTSSFNKNMLKENNLIIYQDICSRDYPGNIHLSLKKLCEIVPREERHKIYCMHLDTTKLSNLAQNEGFNIVSIE